MCGVYCPNCKRYLSVSKFQRRDDRNSLYKWCSDCMISGGRSEDYPPEKDQGGGRIYVSVEELE